MSNPDPRSIGFTHTQPQQNFKLLELPPELVELLSSDHPPTLYLKSPASTPASQSGHGHSSKSSNGDFVNLCTPTQTYILRQVHSSNSIFLIKPSERPRDDHTINSDVNGRPDAGTSPHGKDPVVTAIALCKSTMELHEPDKSFSAFPFLLQSLRVYDGPLNSGDRMDIEDGMDGTDTTQSRKVIKRVFADVPLSPVECKAAWINICAFVHLDPTAGRLVAWQPFAAVKLEVWKKILEGSLLHEINLEKQFLARDLWKAILDPDDDGTPFPRTLFDALIRRLTDNTSVSLYSEMNWASLDKNTTAKWIGEIYLETTAPDTGRAISHAQFLEAWRDLLPESWRAEASLDNMEVRINHFY
ncbi:hypothetical protein AJ80_08870 [Polytolypa hystricis UAMH7299]|uniref:Sister chromatid cohesion protein Dcc1 n=1 Tax=Polytolypa hystricis (strain UAMH7299) TaxID=1447883 RepID=A0A2B7X0Z5_POLH7|nr:hypothetical protein AJ80_08870 [Polytolypa hystricis UAMH7299]